jgi:stage 0 sporulation protein B (sporulation initiation phosphotransferase)
LDELEKRVHNSKQRTVEVTEWIHTKEEWILELIVPFSK